MNILHLKYAAEIAKTGSLNKAAENLYMGQPNLSRAIKELEETLGITIFKRSSRGMSVTPEGEEFLQYANKILAEIDEVEALYKKETPAKQKFSISVPRASYIADAFMRFSLLVDKEKPTEILYNETNSMRAVKNILESNYRMGIIRYAEDYDKQFKEMLDDKGLVYEPVSDFCYLLLISARHPLAGLDEVRFSNLKPFTEIAHADPYVPSMPLSTVLKKELPDDIHKRIFVFERASQLELLGENTDTFMWVSPMPKKILCRYGLVQRKCAGNTRIYKDMLIYRKDYQLTDIDRLFIGELCNAKKAAFED